MDCEPSTKGQLAAILEHHGQQHLLFGWDRLSIAERDDFARQISRIDFPTIRTLYDRRDAPAAAWPDRSRIAPMPVRSDWDASSRQAGEEAIRRGEVAVLLVAGGQGSRLGFEKPKGMFPIGPVSQSPLFRIHAEKVRALARRYSSRLPLLVMTGPATHAETEEYFRNEGDFGLPADNVIFFQQGTMPSVDLATGRILLEQPGRLFLSPNGHGGTLTALADTGVLAGLEARGIRHVFYFQVDNPLVKVCDPTFLGSHIAEQSAASSKVVYKELPGEKVGVLAMIDGRCSIIEYSDMPADMAAERDESGHLRFRAGNPAIHIFDVGFLRWLTGGNRLPYHLARKKVPYFDTATGQAVQPATENALKFELFIFDALPLADRWLAVQTSRAEEFAPVKNATGADSPESSRTAISRLHAGWLRAAGIAVPTSAGGDPVHPVEISPLFALDAEECVRKVKPDMRIDGPMYLC